MDQDFTCSVCGGECSLLDVVDFNKCCEEANGQFLKRIGKPFYYALCSHCGFCFCPEIMSWSLEQFETHIYNEDYAKIDPDYLENRPKETAESLISIFGDRAHMFKHLDYGGGNGSLSKRLCAANFQSTSYDPFVDRGMDLTQLGKFDLITAYEVFEHVPDVQQLMSNLTMLLAPKGIILFSTLVSDGNIHPKKRLDWWYAAPRNGHISLFSNQSLLTLAQSRGFAFGSFSEALHIFFTEVPPWANHIIRSS